MSLEDSKDDTKDTSRYSLEPDAKKSSNQNDSPYGVFTQIADGFYLTDGRQDKVNPQAFGGIIMSEEARRVATRLRYLSNEEIGVLEMQVCMKWNSETAENSWSFLFSDFMFILNM